MKFLIENQNIPSILNCHIEKNKSLHKQFDISNEIKKNINKYLKSNE